MKKNIIKKVIIIGIFFSIKLMTVTYANELDYKKQTLDYKDNQLIISEDDEVLKTKEIDDTNKGEWSYENGKWYYIIYGSPIKNRTYLIDGKTYIFDHTGAMIEESGLILLPDNSHFGLGSYYGNGDGTVITSQWQYKSDSWFYYDETGKLVEYDTRLIDGKVYAFEYHGEMSTTEGWIYLDGGRKCYGNGDGTVKTSQWIKYYNEWYYVDENGIRISNNIHEIDGKVYLFDEYGVMVDQKGWTKLVEGYYYGDTYYKDIYWFYGNGDGTIKTSQWIKDNGTWYYVDEYGFMLENCTYEENGKLYVFDGTGAMVEKNGWILIDHWNAGKVWLYGNGDGTVKVSQWIKDAGRWYYVDEYGAMIESSIHEENGKIYVFDSTGVMIERNGWISIDHWNAGKVWLYGNGDGTVKVSQWIKDGGKWYYLDINGVMIKDSVYTIDGEQYLFDSTGAMIEKRI